MTALDPVEVTRLLDALNDAQWVSFQHDDDDRSVTLSGSLPVATVDDAVTLVELLPELAEDWLRLRTEVDELAGVLRMLSCNAVDAGPVEPTAEAEGASAAYEHASELVDALLGGVSEGNPK